MEIKNLIEVKKVSEVPRSVWQLRESKTKAIIELCGQNKITELTFENKEAARGVAQLFHSKHVKDSWKTSIRNNKVYLQKK